MERRIYQKILSLERYGQGTKILESKKRETEVGGIRLGVLRGSPLETKGGARVEKGGKCKMTDQYDV